MFRQDPCNLDLDKDFNLAFNEIVAKAKRKTSKSLGLIILLVLAITLVVGVVFVSSSGRVFDFRSRAASICNGGGLCGDLICATGCVKKDVGGGVCTCVSQATPTAIPISPTATPRSTPTPTQKPISTPTPAVSCSGGKNVFVTNWTCPKVNGVYKCVASGGHYEYWGCWNTNGVCTHGGTFTSCSGGGKKPCNMASTQTGHGYPDGCISR